MKVKASGIVRREQLLLSFAGHTVFGSFWNGLEDIDAIGNSNLELRNTLSHIQLPVMCFRSVYLGLLTIL